MPRNDLQEEKQQNEQKEVQVITQDQLTNVKLDQITVMLKQILEYYKPKEAKKE